MIKFPIKYNNGNYSVIILEDGTKIQETFDYNATSFNPARPETLDINISNYCENNCPYCYIDASVKGRHGNLNHPFFDTIPEYIEIALNYTDHPGLLDLLCRMKERNIIVNFTINQMDLEKPGVVDKLIYWQVQGYFHGLGISVMYKSEKIENICDVFDNVVIHTINGVTTNEMYKYISTICDKVLVLGFKRKGRALNYKKNLIDISTYGDNGINSIETFSDFYCACFEDKNGGDL